MRGEEISACIEKKLVFRWEKRGKGFSDPGAKVAGKGGVGRGGGGNYELSVVHLALAAYIHVYIYIYMQCIYVYICAHLCVYLNSKF